MEDLSDDNKKSIRFRQNTLKTGNQNKFWVFFITTVSFVGSAVLLFISQSIFESVDIIPAVVVVMIIVITGIISDTIGVAVAAADETPFHAMASRKHHGARRAIRLIRNADRVASFCNDVVGDICGVISGTAGAYIVFRIAEAVSIVDAATCGILFSGMIASVTVGGKALGKTFAIRNSNYIVYKVSLVIDFFIKS